MQRIKIPGQSPKMLIHTIKNSTDPALPEVIHMYIYYSVNNA